MLYLSAILLYYTGFSLPFVRWRSRNQTRVFMDAGVYLLGRSLDETDSIITYSVGFSPNEIERIEILLSVDNDPRALDSLSRLEPVKSLDWAISTESAPTLNKVVLSNTHGNPNIQDPATFVKSPSELEKVTLAIVKAIESIITLIGSA